MYGISEDDIVAVDKKIDFQKKYLKNMRMDFGDKNINILDNTYSANLNPKKYFSEINNRVNTIFANAKDKGLMPVFVTLTAPSQYHKEYNTKTGEYNTPNQTSKDLTQIWNKFTRLNVFAKMKKELNHGLIYFRVYEPHKSGVPHLHAMIFLPKKYILEVKKKYKEYFSSDKWGANKKAIDFKYTWYKERGGAVGYIMKYILKTFKDEDTQKVEKAVYWYIKHKVRRFLSSRTLAPLAIYRKVRHYFKDKFKDDYKFVTQALEDGNIYKLFDDTVIEYRYFDYENGEFEDIILWSKNANLILNARAKKELDEAQNKKQRENFIYIKPIKKEFESLDYTNIWNWKANKVHKINGSQIIPSKLKDYQLVRYYKEINECNIENVNINHYILTKNEMIIRGLLNESLQKFNQDLKSLSNLRSVIDKYDIDKNGEYQIKQIYKNVCQDLELGF